MPKLVLMRHGQSIWNDTLTFTGWTDVNLSDTGIQQAHSIGRALKDNGFAFDIAFTSVLKRSVKTLWILLEEMDLMWIPTHCSWRLNERHWGRLQGVSMEDVAINYGVEQLRKWRFSYDSRPPALDETDPRHPRFDPRYRHLVNTEKIPSVETVEDILKRLLPLWEKLIVPYLRDNKEVLIVAHRNSLRTLIKHLENKSVREFVGIDVPVNVPIVYELNDDLEILDQYPIQICPNLAETATSQPDVGNSNDQ